MFIKNLQRKIRSLNVILETTKVMGDDLTCWEEPKLTCSIPYPKSVTDGGLRVECIKKFKDPRVTRKENLKWKSILGGFNFLSFESIDQIFLSVHTFLMVFMDQIG